MSDAFYFGCVGTSGHYLHTPDLRTASRAGPFTPAMLDTHYCPNPATREQPEGVARLTHFDGWTVLAFWDRSVDTRGNSHSTFVLRGTHAYDDAVRLAREAFPRVWSRYTFTVRSHDAA